MRYPTLAFILIFAPFLFPGLIQKVKALWAGKQGAPVAQPLWDFLKLLRKGVVISGSTSPVFRLAPPVILASVVFAAFLVPVPQQGALLAFPADFVLFAYALGLAKFLLILLALDTGSPFEGMGASREAAFSTIVEPAFFLLMGSLALVTGRTSFEAVFALLNYSSGYTVLVKSLCVASLFIMLLTEGSRVPVDDPNTHLELTMIHEVMILDSSGPDLAFLQYAAGLKLVLIGTLLANLLVPPGTTGGAAFLMTLAVLALCAAAVGLVESFIARARMSHVPQFVFLMMALSVTAFAVVMFFLHGAAHV